MQPRRKVKNRLLSLLYEKASKEGRKIQQAELAEAIGVSENTISSWIRGVEMTKINLSVVERLCEYFNCEIGDLLYLEPVVDEGE